MMHEITLPERFEEKLKGTEFHSAATFSLKKFTSLLNEGGNLFPEYTDHSSAHIQDVLNTAEKIIAAESYELLTAADIYVLTISICLHDSAMTFSIDDLREIVRNEKYNARLFGYKVSEEPTWEVLWKNFKKEFCNYSETDLVSIVGESFTPSKTVPEYFPSFEDKDLSQSQLKVAGEFVRLHHARLAHTIAVSGYPNLEQQDVFLEDFQEYNNLAGLVARSHHHSMRGMYNRLRSDQRLVYRDCHLVFLMAVLRISDLMQITSERTPLITFKSKSFWSVYSENEWKRHLSMIGYKHINSDPACIFCEISENVESIRILHNIRSLLQYFQYELDMVWASLGEAYGDSELSKLKILYRRVSSELDNEEFLFDLPFYSKAAVFRVDLSLIQKLITPLYGDLPEIGIRELLQNALDTTRERRYIDTESVGAVRVGIYQNEGRYEFRISDEGCGMDADIIRNYFLCIGSSFRSSKNWVSEFAIEQQSQVNRSGRFGIGMLAGFILGNEIDVTTRRINDDGHAIQFCFSLDSDIIQLNKIDPSNVPIGTLIKIIIDEETYLRLKNTPVRWQWYFQLENEIDEVEYYIDGELQRVNTKAPQDMWEPIPELEQLFPNFKWGLTHSGLIGQNALFVNNLKISRSAEQATIYNHTLDTYDADSKSWVYDISFPPIALEDPNLKLPLNLERNGFSKEFVPYGKALLSSVTDRYLGQINDFDSEVLDLERGSNALSRMFLGLTKTNNAAQQLQRSQISLWGLHNDGYVFSDYALLKEANVERIYIIGPHLNSGKILEQLPLNSVVFKMISDTTRDQYRTSTKVTYKEEYLLNFLRNKGFIFSLFSPSCWEDLKKLDCALTINKKRLEKIDASGVVSSQKIFVTEGAEAVCLSFSEAIKGPDIPVEGGDFIVMIDISQIGSPAPVGPLAKEWLDQMNSPILNKDTRFNERS